MKYFLISVEFYNHLGMSHLTISYYTDEVFINKEAIRKIINAPDDFFILFIKELTEEEYNYFNK